MNENVNVETGEVSEDTETKTVTVHKSTQIVNWDDAVEIGQHARQIRQKIIEKILVLNEDYGKPFEGSVKYVLLKAGAEKITDAFNCYPDFEILTEIEEWNEKKPLFYYKIKCYLRQRGTEIIVATGLGSCNIRESRYWWRDQKRKCPKCEKETIIKGRQEYGGGWICHAKRGGCGAKFPDNDVRIVKQETGRILNPDIFDQVNTIFKMAKKRAHVDAALNFGFSDKFTQDLEDFNSYQQKPDIPKSNKRLSSKQTTSKKKTEFDGIAEVIVKISNYEKACKNHNTLEKFKKVCFDNLGTDDFNSIQTLKDANMLLKKLEDKKDWLKEPMNRDFANELKDSDKNRFSVYSEWEQKAKDDIKNHIFKTIKETCGISNLDDLNNDAKWKVFIKECQEKL